MMIGRPHIAVAALAAGLLAGACGGAASADGTSQQSPHSTMSQIAYDCGEIPDICVMNADGSHIRRLAADPANDEDPAWSPDGRRIAFASARAGGPEQLFVMDADGSHLHALTTDAGRKFAPRWSPDGTRIAFSTDRRGNLDVMVLTLATGRTRPLAASSDDEMDPSFSPDGRWIAFDRAHGQGFPSIYLMPAAGGRPQLLGPGMTPVFSPDGTHLVLAADGLRVVDLGDGSSITLTHGATDTEPSWSPDGSHIVFRRGFIDDNADLYVVPSGGGTPVRLTRDPAPEVMPNWRP